MDPRGKMYALAILFGLLPTAAVALRFKSRRKLRLQIWLDDWLILFAWLATIALCVLMIVGAAVGNLGRHVRLDSQGHVIEDYMQQVFRLTTFANDITQLLSLGPTKLSVLFFYRRVFRGQIFNILSWVLIAIVAAWTIAFFFANLFVCVPINSHLDVPQLVAMGYRCINSTKMSLAQSYTDFSLEALIIALPIPMILKLKMPFTQRIQICLIFLLGMITTAASIIRKVIQYYAIQMFDTGNPDTPIFLQLIVFAPIVESSLGIVAACLPTMRVLFENWSIAAFRKSLASALSKAGLLRKSPSSSTRHDNDDDFVSKTESLETSSTSIRDRSSTQTEPV